MTGKIIMLAMGALCLATGCILRDDKIFITGQIWIVGGVLYHS